jgi:hypothetical protein
MHHTDGAVDSEASCVISGWPLLPHQGEMAPADEAYFCRRWSICSDPKPQRRGEGGF